jgi:hypothetical protein
MELKIKDTLTKREYELMLSMGIILVKSIEELALQIEKREDKKGAEYLAGLKVGLQLMVEILESVNEEKKAKYKD